MIAIVVGTRPEMTKMAPVVWELQRRGTAFCLIHTGQHYDVNMSDVFFEELKLPRPDRFLGVGSADRETQIQRVNERMQQAIRELGVRVVCVVGDTNSVLGAALAARQCGCRVAHVESGARSFVPGMPEEVNRIACDQISDVRFAPTPNCIENLKKEGITSGVVLSGNTEVQALAHARGKKRAPGFSVKPGFALVTLHRQSNANPERLTMLWRLLESLQMPVVFLVHPRTENVLKQCGLWQRVPKNVQLEPPVGYFELVWLLDQCGVVMTDSGGLQVEAAILQKPVLILRDETEWVEIVSARAGALVGLDANSPEKARAFLQTFKPQKSPFVPGESRLICDHLEAELTAHEHRVH